MYSGVKRSVQRSVDFASVSWRGKRESVSDFLAHARGAQGMDPGAEVAASMAMKWLSAAQDRSSSQDGGVARHYSFNHGWSPSYPETTGYIASTFLEYATDPRSLASESKRTEYIERAKRMLDWLVSIQFADGSFQGGTVDVRHPVPVTFNTGQILLGLASGVEHIGDRYRNAMIKAADWLVKTQDPDGCWRKAPTPFAAPGEKAYETHVAWGLLEAARLEPKRHYQDAALKNIRWALSHQQNNGWFGKCCLDTPTAPYTHTIGYLLRGLIEGYRYSKDEEILKAAELTGRGIISALRNDGFLPGRLTSSWGAPVPWSCLTGAAQLACCWLLLAEYLGDDTFRDAAYRANSFVRRTLIIDGPPDICGALKGSFPVYGEYGKFELLSWGAKFLIDSNLLELRSKAKRIQSMPTLSHDSKRGTVAHGNF